MNRLPSSPYFSPQEFFIRYSRSLSAVLQPIIALLCPPRLFSLISRVYTNILIRVIVLLVHIDTNFNVSAKITCWHDFILCREGINQVFTQSCDCTIGSLLTSSITFLAVPFPPSSLYGKYK